MSELSVKSAKFISLPENFSGLISAELEAFSAQRGDVFALLKVTSRDAAAREAIGGLIHESLLSMSQNLNEDANIPHRFEQTIQTINEGIDGIIKGGARINANDLQMVIGVVSEHQVFVTGLGNLHALFLHRTVKQRYVIYELDAQFKAEEQSDQSKPLVTILDGELHPGDVFYVATRVPTREIDLAQLQDILVTLPPVSALKRIEQHLGPETAYAGLCFQVMEDDVAGPPKKTNPLTSIEQLGKTKDETANLLGDQHPDVVGLIGRITGPIIKKLSAPGTRGFKSNLRRLLRFLIKTLSGLLVLLLMLSSRLWLFAKIVGRLLKKVYLEKIADQTARQKFAQRLKQIWCKLQNLPKSTKIGLLAGGLTVLVLFIGLTVWKLQAERSRQAQEFAQTLSAIEEKRTAAEASLIYDNTEQARTLLANAESLLNNLHPNSAEQESELAKVSTALDQSLFALRGIAPVEPKILMDVSAVSGGTWQDLFLFEDTIYVLGKNGDLWSYSDLNSTGNQIELTRGLTGLPVQASSAKNGFLFVDDQQKLGYGQLTNKTVNPTVSGVEKLGSAQDLSLYNDNLYVLSPSAQQIIKMRPQGDGFEAGTSWITSRNSDLTKSVALAIDGDVYVLNSTGLVKFSSGREVDLIFENVDPAITQAIDTWTSLESKYLYILESAQSRVVVFDKQGKFITQYTSEGLQGGLELQVRESKKEIVVATQTQILTFTASHLLQ